MDFEKKLDETRGRALRPDENYTNEEVSFLTLQSELC